MVNGIVVGNTLQLEVCYTDEAGNSYLRSFGAPLPEDRSINNVVRIDIGTISAIKVTYH